MGSDAHWIINLGNSICGVSLLALPYCFSQCGVVLGTILLLFSATLTVWSCKLLLECVFVCKSAAYESIAQELYGRFGKLFIELSSISLNLGCCSAFFVIVGDLAPGVITSLSWAASSLPSTPTLRILILAVAGITIVLPLSLLRNLEPLSFVSIASLIFYSSLTLQLFVLAMNKIRTDEISSYIQLWDWNGVFHIMPIYALAFSCHLQLIAMTREVIGDIRDVIEDCNRMKFISQGAVTVVATVYGSVSLFGYTAFCENGLESDVLSNFNDGMLAQITRCGFTLSVIVSFPFVVNPCRATLFSLLYGRTEKYISTNKHALLTIIIVLFGFFIAVYTPNVAVVLALTGSISGAIICYLFPAISYLMFTKNRKINYNKSHQLKALILIAIGFLLLTVGSMSAVSSSSSKETDDHTSQVIAQNDEVLIPPDKPVEDNVIPVNVIDGENIDDDIKAAGAPIGGRMLQENENTEHDIESVHSIQLSSEEQTTTKHILDRDEGNEDSVLDKSETNQFAEPVVLHNNPNNDEGNVHLDDSILDKREIDLTNQFAEPVILHNNPNGVLPADEDNVHLDDSISDKKEIDSTNQFVKPVILPLDQNDHNKSTKEHINKLDQEKEFLDFHDSIPENPSEGFNLKTHRDTSNDIIPPHVLFNEEQDPVLHRKEQDIPSPILQEDTMETDNKEHKQSSSKVNIDQQPISVNNPTQLGHDLK